MNNTEKLLRAFIDASGYDVEEITKTSRMYLPPDVIMADAVSSFGARPKETIINTSYKVTKKEGVDADKGIEQEVNWKDTALRAMQADYDSGRISFNEYCLRRWGE